MLDPKIFDDIAERLSRLVPTDLRNTQNDLKKNFETILQSSFAKLNLVTREEFDTQLAVLQKTRAKLESLTEQITLLEQKLADKN